MTERSAREVQACGKRIKHKIISKKGIGTVDDNSTSDRYT